jgi:dihydroceramidase
MYGRGSRGLLAPNADFMSVALLLLGIASFLFHATLRQTLQLADELAMLGLTWSLLQGVMTVRHSSTYDRIVNVTLGVVFSLFAIFYVWTEKIIYHAIGFAITLILITIRGCYLFYWRVPRLPESKCKGWKSRGQWSLAILIIGYILWNIDLECCMELRRVKGRIGLPWAWLFELHGWWHVLTAISANQFMQVVRELQEELTSQKKE